MDIKNKVIIFGKNGQVASNLIKIFDDKRDFNVTSFSSKEVDFSKLNELESFLQNLKTTPNFIINAAAYTLVDKAEEEKELCDIINDQAVLLIANYCKKNDVTLIHYSTDYVFDGLGNEPYLEDNTKNLHPLNHYGYTKLLAERAIINSGCKYLILRTSWVYDDEGKNFVNTIKRLAMEKEELSIISDQIGSPTAAFDIANNTVKIIEKNLNPFPSGIYHFVSNKFMSWYDFAIDIIDSMKKSGIEVMVKKVNPILSKDYKTLAARPMNSRLNCDKLKKVFDLEILYEYKK
jgi:dTDP-4-dehydrorhamnose reductase